MSGGLVAHGLTDELSRILVVMDPAPANGSKWEESQVVVRRHLCLEHVAEFCRPVRGQLGKMPNKPTPLQEWQAMQAQRAAQEQAKLEAAFLKEANEAAKDGKNLHITAN